LRLFFLTERNHGFRLPRLACDSHRGDMGISASVRAPGTAQMTHAVLSMLFMSLTLAALCIAVVKKQKP
jgi:hypothetical protein